MRITIAALKEINVSPATKEWMDTRASNQQMLFNSWKEDELYRDDFDTLIECLAYEIQKEHPKKAIVGRLKGRLAKVRHQFETREFDCFLTPSMGFLI